MPSSALYWHIGAMTTRLRSSRFLILKGSNNVDIMCSSFNVNFIVTETGPNIKDKGSVRNKKPLRYGGRGKSSSIFFERDDRSEERRVGKERRSRWGRGHDEERKQG